MSRENSATAGLRNEAVRLQEACRNALLVKDSDENRTEVYNSLSNEMIDGIAENMQRAFRVAPDDPETFNEERNSSRWLADFNRSVQIHGRREKQKLNVQHEVPTEEEALCFDAVENKIRSRNGFEAEFRPRFSNGAGHQAGAKLKRLILAESESHVNHIEACQILCRSIDEGMSERDIVRRIIKTFGRDITLMIAQTREILRHLDSELPFSDQAIDWGLESEAPIVNESNERELVKTSSLLNDDVGDGDQGSVCDTNAEFGLTEARSLEKNEPLFQQLQGKLLQQHIVERAQEAMWRRRRKQREGPRSKKEHQQTEQQQPCSRFGVFFSGDRRNSRDLPICNWCNGENHVLKHCRSRILGLPPWRPE